MILDFAKKGIAINFSVYAYMSKNLQMESTTFKARIMNYNQLADKATMYFEWQTDFGRWVKISCITMSLFIVIRDSKIRFLAGQARFRNLQTDLFCIKRDFIGPIKYTF